jgi:hypothetical protein
VVEMLDLIPAHLAVQQTRDLARSALPDAPVRPEPELGVGVLRRLAAVGLRRLADRLQPVPTLSAQAR